MTLVITEVFFGIQKRIENAKFIPRVGEHIEWHYKPSPKVKNVRYDFDNDTVFVSI